MEMQQGVAIIERDDTKTNAVFIDHEVIEFARLHALTKKRIAKAKADQHNKSRILRREAKAEAEKKAYNRKTIKSILIHSGIFVGAVWVGLAGLVHPFIWISAAIIHLCTACLYFGAWFGRKAR